MKRKGAVTIMKYIFFDLDGTITDPKEGITKSVQYSLKKFGIEVTDLDSLCKFIGPPLNVSYEEFYGFSHEEAMKAVDEYRVYYKDRGIFECKLYDGIKELLAHLSKNGNKVVLATSKPIGFAKQLLEHFDIIQYFDFVAGSEMDGTRTDKSEVIEYALSHYPGIDVNDVVMIGDRKFDYIGASKYGIPCILIEYGYGERKELENCKPFAIKETVEELQKFLDSITLEG